MSNVFLACKFALSLMIALLILPFDVQACTGLRLKAKDGSFVNGRTLEFGVQLDTSILFIPRDYAFKGTTPQGPGHTYKSKYAAIGAIAFDNIALLDGMNEKGLSVGTFYFPGYARYSKITAENKSKALSPIDFPNWVLTQFATVEEVKAALPQVVISPTVYSGWGSEAPPFHYVVYDKSGKSIVIEPIEGELVVSDNPLGVFTNSPGFDWHMTNVRNYINLTPFNVKPLDVDNIVLAPFGQGSGMVGMPGDFTPPSRFVQAAIFSITSLPSKNSEEAVLQAFHILNQFDIPVGNIREMNNGVVHSDFTMITCVKDPQALKYYFKTYENQSIRMADLNKFAFDSKSVKRMPTSGNKPVQDISADLK